MSEQFPSDIQENQWQWVKRKVSETTDFIGRTLKPHIENKRYPNINSNALESATLFTKNKNQKPLKTLRPHDEIDFRTEKNGAIYRISARSEKEKSSLRYTFLLITKDKENQTKIYTLQDGNLPKTERAQHSSLVTDKLEIHKALDHNTEHEMLPIITEEQQTRTSYVTKVEDVMLNLFAMPRTQDNSEYRFKVQALELMQAGNVQRNYDKSPLNLQLVKAPIRQRV